MPHPPAIAARAHHAPPTHSPVKLAETVRNLGRPRVLVVGDVILDRYIWGEAERVSQEAPVILLRESKREVRLGGAANVANMLAGLGAQPVVAGVVGDDSDGRACRGALENAGVATGGLIADPARPTTVKERFLGRAHHRHPHQMLRVDREVRDALSPHVEDALLARVEQLLPTVAAVLLSDYGKGVLTPRVAAGVIAAAKKAGLPVLADPPGSGDCSRFRGATAITPNRTETGRAVGKQIETIGDAEAAGRQLVLEYDLSHAFVTIDSDGIVLAKRVASEEGGAGDCTTSVHPTRRRGVSDITGAGDVVLAVIGLAAAEGLSPEDQARLANVAGGIEVEKVGCAPVTRDEIVADLLSGGRGGAGRIVQDADALAELLAHRQASGQTVVFTNGCFDLLHAGHVASLEEASAQGDVLVVAVNTDASVRGLGKGSDRPLIPEEQRIAMLAALRAVDYVIPMPDATPHRLLRTLRPDVLVKGGTYSRDEIVGHEVVDGYGGSVRPLGVLEGWSTTQIVERIRGESSASDASQSSAPAEDEKIGDDDPTVLMRRAA
ncbi:PfkB family carbohydrate kinase [Alienimonas chondri]|uniref:Bifunctional protein HldE n=1 Tax=Alienimonas chondri TaxID=2681879 RepID=A0ABX1VF32_9PLAN|nr:bifunctional heptose 7-phosphate kinase/heptose 1-phosphate adenyltransferase [Alienimonas chondri]NNJ26709.1 Bifunctional protein HldE [Alienimonas chondri]